MKKLEKLTAELHVVLDNTLGGRACRYMPTVALSSTAISKKDNDPITFYRQVISKYTNFRKRASMASGGGSSEFTVRTVRCRTA